MKRIGQETQQKKVSILEDISKAERQIKTGKTDSHTKAKNNILKRFKRISV